MILAASTADSGDAEPSEEDEVIVRTEHPPHIRLLLALRRSFLLFTMFTGVVMIVSGLLVELLFANQGVVAAMLVIWGVSAIIFGALGFVVVIALGLR